MPKKMVWIELLFSRFPIDKKISSQMLVRFCFLFLVWLTGFLAYTLDGLMISYISNLQIYQGLFGSGLIILFGSYMFQHSLPDIIPSFRSLLKLNDSLFQKFSERVERYSYSFIPCLLIALVFMVLWSSVPNDFQRVLIEGSSLHGIWDISISIFVYLLVATGIWFGISIWLTIFLISRQPLEIDLSQKTIEKFRGLTMLALWFSLFYFLAISISIIISFIGSPAVPLLEVIFSPNFFLIGIGIISILFPFYNIHNTLLKVKKQELFKIEDEIEQLRQQLDEVLARQPAKQFGEQTITFIGRLFSLQLKERNIKAAQEWPIDISFLTKLFGLVLIPTICRILIEILNRFYI